MSEALQAVLEFGFETLNLHRIWAGTDLRNLPSCRMLERNGLVREGVLLQASSGSQGDLSAFLVPSRVVRRRRATFRFASF